MAQTALACELAAWPLLDVDGRENRCTILSAERHSGGANHTWQHLAHSLLPLPLAQPSSRATKENLATQHLQWPTPISHVSREGQ